jgi:hypothetical protein
MLVPYFGELFLAESGSELDQCWPQTAMHVRNLAFNQLTNEDVGTLANRLRSAKDLFPFWMAPPTAPDGTTNNRLREIWKMATSGLEDDSVTFNKCERFLLVHNTSSAVVALPSNETEISHRWRQRAWLGMGVFS